MRNSNITKVLYLILFVWIISASAFAQTKKNTPKKNNIKRFVTVTLRQGETLKGVFSNASSVGIQIIVSNNSLNLRWNEISQIFFTDAASNQLGSINHPQIKNNPAIENALKSLRKLAAATEVGINFQEYNRRVIDVKAEIEEFIPKIDNSYIRSEIRFSITYYQLAVTHWNNYIVDKTGSEFGFRDKLNDYWEKARKHLENATRGETEK